MVFQGKEIAGFDLQNIKVVALVGPSGTGKSQKSMWVAEEYSCDAIIDDGLLIAGSRIVAGKSAKREETKTAAIRRAIFSSPSHALEVREALEELAPKKVLVLGTSVTMVERIVSRLGLSLPEEILDIRDLSTPEEIREALWQRRREGKHVIPAPSFEVKKTFSGYLVDPLRMLTFPRQEKKPQITEKSVVRPTYSYFGHYYIADAVVMQMAQKIAQEVPGVKRVLRTVVLPSDQGVILEIELVLGYGSKVFEVMSSVQQRLKDRLEYLTGIYLEEVNVITKKIGLE